MTKYLVSETGGYPTIFVESQIDSREEAAQLDANADFIIRAVNAHDDLLAACKAASVLTSGCVCDGGIACLHCTLNNAIAKAEAQ